MKQSLGLAVLALGAALAVPAVASAHPSVYTADSYGIKAGTTDERELQTRYVVSNHGYTIVLRETNNLAASAGVVGYNMIPGGWRAGKSFADVMAAGGSGAQAHATCLTPALQTEAAIRSWQDDDAFYNYVPFQATSAGLEDDPARWLPTLAGAGFDVSRLGAEAEAECEKVPGAQYVPADTVQTTAASLASGTVAEATTPLNAQISTLQSQVEQLRNQVTTLQAAKAAVDAQLAAKPAARPLALKLSAKRFDQPVAMVTGEPGSAVTVRVRLAAGAAKKLKVARTISRKQATIGADGAALVNLGLTKKAARAVDKHVPALKVTVDVTGGGATKTATGTLTR